MNQSLLSIDETVRELLKYSLLIEKQSESLKSPLMSLHSKLRVLLARSCTQLGVMKGLGRALADEGVDSEDSEERMDQPKDLPSYEPLKQYIQQLSTAIERALMPVPQRLESFERASALLVSVLNKLPENSEIRSMAAVELLRAKRLLAGHRNQLNSVWEAQPLQNGENASYVEAQSHGDLHSEIINLVVDMSRDTLPQIADTFLSRAM